MKNYKNILAPIFAVLCWSSSYIMTNIAFQSFRPISLVFFRVIIASVFMLVIGFSTARLNKIKKEHWKWFILLGFIEPFAYFLCETYGLTLISATLAAVILSTIPLFTPLFTSLFLRERVTLFNILGLIVSLVGVAMIIFIKDNDFTFETAGFLLLLGAVVSAIIYSLFVRKMAEEYSEITIVTIQNVIGVFLFMPLFFIVDFQHLGELPLYTDALVSVVVLGIFVSALAFIFYAYALKNIGVILTNSFMNLLPAMTAVFAYFVLGDQISIQQMLGIAVVIFGLYVNQIKSKKTLVN